MKANWKKKKSLQVALISSNAALYAAVGVATYLGIFTPVFGTVRFWPSVVIPAAFSILFSPWIGAVGAAIGIFISDMVVHGNPILSITVGVTSNFIGFYLIGILARGRINMLKRFLSGGVQAIPLGVALVQFFSGALDEITSYIFLIVAIIVMLIGIGFAQFKPKYSKIIYASSIGLMVGSAIIGLGLWLYSQFAVLPLGVSNAPIVAALTWFLWTYLTEVPFLVFLLPPIVYAVSRAMPERVEVEKVVS
ncbi:MAG: hypothetical protein NZ929_00945 [Aigarchaeota archaeon]|nr:hypothetical protein [Aigarchaeota archaeon]MCX8192223.1 hypothetical protein [Nitrososphaeria archaeon]MDW7986169.1 hypothetical protein [Nitrososphaerota archaeon]